MKNENKKLLNIPKESASGISRHIFLKQMACTPISGPNKREYKGIIDVILEESMDETIALRRLEREVTISEVYGWIVSQKK